MVYFSVCSCVHIENKTQFMTIHFLIIPIVKHYCCHTANYIFLTSTSKQSWQTITLVTIIKHIFWYIKLCVVCCHINSPWTCGLVWPMWHLQACTRRGLTTLAHWGLSYECSPGLWVTMYRCPTTLLHHPWGKKRGTQWALRCPSHPKWGSNHVGRSHLEHSSSIKQHSHLCPVSIVE